MRAMQIVLWAGISGCFVKADYPTDMDQDGVPADEDCDDSERLLGHRDDDADCDGAPTEDDCDDWDPLSTTVASDADCDGVPTEDDCDDGDPLSTTVAFDADCDGVPAEDDCDDNDPWTYPGAPETGVGLWDDPACDGGGGSLALADLAFLGAEPGATAGLADAGDFDGDGLSDIIIGAPHYSGDPELGTAYVVWGSSVEGLAGSTLSLGDADIVFGREDDTVWSGGSSVAVGDVDGDGLEDLWVDSSWPQRLYLFLGRSLRDSTASTIELGSADYVFTVGVDTIPIWGRKGGDVDGDGLDDVLVGGFCDSAYLFLGGTLASSFSTEFDVEEADIQFDGGPFSVSGTVGDVDGDGLDDISLDPCDSGSDAGRGYLVFGRTLVTHSSSTFPLRSADVEFFGGEGSNIGLQAAGDVDGDGQADVLVNAEESDESRSAHLFLGSSLAASGSPTVELHDAEVTVMDGRSANTAGDVDGDGLDDVLVLTFPSGEIGSAHLFLGSSLAAGGGLSIELQDADFSFTGEGLREPDGGFAAGDVNGDGRDDILVGAMLNNEAGPKAGKTYLLLSGL